MSESNTATGVNTHHETNTCGAHDITLRAGEVITTADTMPMWGKRYWSTPGVGHWLMEDDIARAGSHPPITRLLNQHATCRAHAWPTAPAPNLRYAHGTP